MEPLIVPAVACWAAITPTARTMEVRFLVVKFIELMHLMCWARESIGRAMEFTANLILYLFVDNQQVMAGKILLQFGS